MQFSRSLFALAVVMQATSIALLAQVSESALGGTSSKVAHIGGPQANTLSLTSTTIQRLADGTSITRTFTAKHARDSEGRSYSETHETLYIRADGQPVNLVHYSVSDPVARTNISWDDRTKIANVTPMPDSKKIQQRTQPTQVPKVELDKQPHTVRAPRQVSPADLGLRTIAGIEAKGTRTTSIIPAGDVGNDQPLSIVTENWMSTQYRTALLSIINDPRMGKRTDEVTEFQPGEPDPQLFKIPEGYIVRERTNGHPD